MQLSDLTMKKQILFGQIWKRLKIIVVDLNHYELILRYMHLYCVIHPAQFTLYDKCVCKKYTH